MRCPLFVSILASPADHPVAQAEQRLQLGKRETELACKPLIFCGSDEIERTSEAWEACSKLKSAGIGGIFNKLRVP